MASVSFGMTKPKHRSASRKPKKALPSAKNVEQKAVGERLREYRNSHSLTQGQLGDRWGLSAQTISDWETGAVFPSVENLRRIVDSERSLSHGHSTLSVHWLLFGEGARDPLAPDVGAELTVALATYLRSQMPDFAESELAADLEDAELGRRALRFLAETIEDEAYKLSELSVERAREHGQAVDAVVAVRSAISRSIAMHGTLDSPAARSELEQTLVSGVTMVRGSSLDPYVAWGIADAREELGASLRLLGRPDDLSYEEDVDRALKMSAFIECGDFQPPIAMPAKRPRLR